MGDQVVMYTTFTPWPQHQKSAKKGEISTDYETTMMELNAHLQELQLRELGHHTKASRVQVYAPAGSGSKGGQHVQERQHCTE